MLDVAAVKCGTSYLSVAIVLSCCLRELRAETEVEGNLTLSTRRQGINVFSLQVIA